MNQFMNVPKTFVLASIFLIFASLFNSVQGQELKTTLANYNWDENRPRYTLTPEEEQYSKIILCSKSILEYVFENKEFVLYTLDHLILRVNSDDAIESSNKIVISMNGAIEVVNIKARSISRDGKIINLDKNNIKEIKSTKKDESSRIFAIEGVEKGCEIEYFYIKKMQPGIYGHENFQFSSPLKEAFFQLICPNHLSFKFKGYNHFPDVKDTIVDSKHIYTAKAFNVAELRDESVANYPKNRMRVEYKLAYNLVTGKKELNTWANIAQTQYNTLNALTNKEKKEAEKLYIGFKIAKDATDENKIHTIENYIKTNILIQEVYDEEYSSIEKILQNKYANKRGVVKLYMSLFRLAGVNTQLVLTSERSETPFDGSFESYRFLNNYLFYFPSTDKFLTPEEPNFRYPLIPYDLTFTDGLFLKELTVGDYTTFLPLVKFIPQLSHSLTGQKLDVDIDFDENMESAHLTVSNTLKGYYALSIQPFYAKMPDDQRQKVLEALMDNITKDTKYIKLEAENTDLNSTIDKPFIIRAEVRGSAMMERAGSKILFKVGDIIGKQMEMYRDKQRKMSVEYDYNREYTRIIRITIPDGFTVKNLNDLNINQSFERNNDKIYYFTSSYEKNGNTVTVKIEEVYKEISCPLENYDDYRRVINAAADFNKVTLVFERK
jgi:hypothetical protein